MTTTLVWNGSNLDHAQHINLMLSKAISFDCAVAFAKPSGFEMLKVELERFLERGGQARFFIGLDFCVTHPDVLSALHSLTEKYPVTLYALDGGGSYAFHPKVYHFKFPVGTAALIGSANMTKGGLNGEGNYECSVLVTDEHAKILKAHFDSLIQDEELEPIEKPDIKRYRDRYNIAQIARATEKRQIRRLSSATQGVERLMLLLEEFRGDRSDFGFEAQIRERAIRAQTSLRIMKRITQAPARPNALRPLIKDLADSFSSKIVPIYRTRIANQAAGFKKLVGIALGSENAKAEYAFARMREAKVKGIGVNWISEMLHTVNPKRFAVLNTNSLYGMSLATDEFPTTPSTSARRYQQFCDTARGISKHLGLTNVRELDTLFSHIYFSDEE